MAAICMDNQFCLACGSNFSDISVSDWRSLFWMHGTSLCICFYLRKPPRDIRLVQPFALREHIESLLTRLLIRTIQEREHEHQ